MSKSWEEETQKWWLDTHGSAPVAKITEKRLEALEVAVVKHLDIGMPVKVQELAISSLGRQVAYMFQTHIWAEEIEKVEAIASVSYPATWWQHFKRDKMPKWFKRRFPVVSKNIVDRKILKRMATYPSFQYQSQTHDAVIRVIDG